MGVAVVTEAAEALAEDTPEVSAAAPTQLELVVDTVEPG
jgi:hypothetical protein